MKMQLSDFLSVEAKSKIKAGDGQVKGDYKFFTSSPVQSKFINSWLYDAEALVFGTGGNASVHYVNDKFSTSTDCLVMTNKMPDTVNLKCIYYYLAGNIHLLAAGFKGCGLQHISKDFILNIKIDLPERDVQDKIVAVFDLLTTVRTGKEKQLQKFDDLVKSQFIEMFGDPVKNPKCWTVSRLSSHLEVVGGYAFKSDCFKNAGIPVLRIGNINSGAFQANNLVFWEYDEALEKYIMKPGDIVISLTGTVGKDDYANVCILGDDYERYYLNQRNAQLKLGTSVDRLFIAQLLKFPEIKSRLTGISRGVRQANVANRDILNLSVPIPPLELQNEFARFVEQTDKSKFRIKQSLEKLEICYKALLQKYFG